MIVAPEPYRTMFIELVAPLLDSLHMFPFGNIVLHKLTLNFPELIKKQQLNSIQNQRYFHPNPNIYNYTNSFNINNPYK